MAAGPTTCHAMAGEYKVWRSLLIWLITSSTNEQCLYFEYMNPHAINPGRTISFSQHAAKSRLQIQSSILRRNTESASSHTPPRSYISSHRMQSATPFHSLVSL